MSIDDLKLIRITRQGSLLHLKKVRNLILHVIVSQPMSVNHPFGFYSVTFVEKHKIPLYICIYSPH